MPDEKRQGTRKDHWTDASSVRSGRNLPLLQVGSEAALPVLARGHVGRGLRDRARAGRSVPEA